MDILFYRVFLAALFLLLINVFIRKKTITKDYQFFKNLVIKEQYKIIFLTILGGFLLIANWFLFIYAINNVSLQSASFAYLICPILTTILAYFILKEKLTTWQWLSVSLCVISCAILSYGHLKELIFSITIALSFAFYLISQRKNNQFDRFVILTIQMIIASVIILPFYPKYAGEIPQESMFYILLLVIVIIFTIIPLFLNLYALKGMNSSAVGILMYTNPLIHFFLAVFYFKEDINLAQIVSYSLIIISIVIFNNRSIFKKKKVLQ